MSTEVLPETAEPQVAGPEPIATHIRRTAHGRYIVSTGENLLRPYLAWRIIGRMFRKVDPRAQWHNPVLFIVWVCSALTTVVAIADTVKGGPVYSGGLELPPGFDWVVAAWMWLTVLAANLAEALAEGQGRPHAAALKSMRETTLTRRVEAYDPVHDADARAARLTEVNSNDLKSGDIVVLEEGDVIPSDGEAIAGIALVDESAITGESAPVIRESGGDRSAVTGGTRVLSDRLVVRVTVPWGNTVVDRMIALAEGARRRKAPNELALTVLIASFSISFILVALTMNAIASPVAPPVSVPVLATIVVTLVPAEIAALLSVTGIASTFRLLHKGVIVVTREALETAGDVTTVLLDKTGTITEGDRRATRFLPVNGTTMAEFVQAAVWSSLGDPTPEGTSMIQLAADQGYEVADPDDDGRVVLFSAEARMSGRDLPDGTRLRKGAESAVLAWLKHVGTQQSKPVADELRAATDAIARTGGTPLVVAVKPVDGPGRVLGVVQLKDVVKEGVPARIRQLKALGVRTVMVTGDNPLTAEAIAKEVGFDDYVGDATPEDKVALIVKEQAAGHFVAMSGDGMNDAPALAQADIGVAMNGATAAARETANMIVLDDDPTKLVEIIEAGRRQATTRGALVTFNIANDLVRYAVIFPPLFVGAFPALWRLNFLHLSSPQSAILTTLVYSVVVIGILIPLGIAGVPYRTANLAKSLSRNLLYYGVGGIIVPIIGIKLIDMIIALFPGY